MGEAFFCWFETNLAIDMADTPPTYKKEVQTGRKVLRNIPAEIKSAVHGVTTSGIVKTVSPSEDANEETLLDESGVTCTHITSDPKLKLDFSLIAETGAKLPHAGDLIANTNLTPLGVGTGGAIIVNPGAKWDWANDQACQMSFSATWYPFIVNEL